MANPYNRIRLLSRNGVSPIDSRLLQLSKRDGADAMPERELLSV